MRLLMTTLVVAFLAIVDLAKCHGYYSGQVMDMAWRYAHRVVR